MASCILVRPLTLQIPIGGTGLCIYQKSSSTEAARHLIHDHET